MTAAHRGAGRSSGGAPLTTPGVVAYVPSAMTIRGIAADLKSSKILLEDNRPG